MRKVQLKFRGRIIATVTIKTKQDYWESIQNTCTNKGYRLQDVEVEPITADVRI